MPPVPTLMGSGNRPWNEQMIGISLLKLLTLLRHLVKLLHCFSSDMLAGAMGACTHLRTLFRGWQSNIVKYSLKSMWTPLTHCLCFFNKNKYVKRLVCYSDTTWNSFYDFCPHKNFWGMNVFCKGERERIFNHCFVGAQGRFRQNFSRNCIPSL